MKRALPLIYACLASAIPACTGDGTPMFADTDPGSTGDPTTGSGTSGGDTDTEGTTGEPECVYPESLPGYTALREDNGMGGPPGGAVVDGNLDDACPDTFEDDQGVAGGSEFYVYRPAVGMTADWPDQCLPLVVFSPPVGGNPVVMNSSGTPVHTYAHIFDRLAEEGFVVVATQAIGGGMGTGFATNTERAQLAQCAIEWARNEYADYLSDDIALVGHSRGGAAVSIMAPLFASEGLKAVVALAPAVSSGVAGDLEPAPVDPAQAVPYLVIQGNDDEDTTGRGLTNYDFMGVEDRAVDYPIDDYPHDKAMLWAYDARHFVWGGNIAENLNPMVYGQLELDRGHAIAGFYVPAFLRWKVYGWDDERQWFVGPAAYDADASAFPAEVRNSGGTDLWQPLYSQSRFAALGSRPVMLASFSQGVGDEGVRRFRIDTMSRPQDLTCAAPGQSAIFSPSEPIAAPLSEIGFGDACVSTSTNQGLGFHDTNAMELAWGPGDAGDEVRWDIGPLLGSFGLAPYDTLSVRLAKRGAVGTTEDPLEVDVVVETEALDDDGQTIEAAVSYDRVVAQTYQGQSAFNLATALHTTRIPLEDFLSSGQIDLARPRSVALRIPSTGPSSTDMGSLLHVDSLELTGHPLDASTMDLGEDAFWRCEATTALVVTETACDTTPVTGTCPVGSETTTSLALPSVDDTTGSFDGWLVGTHAGWIANPNAPTTTELDGLVQRCVTACEREYEGRPHVSANCADVGVFQSPTRFTAAARMTRRAVPEPFRDGSGIEAGQSLTCDLMDDCCAEFDEDVCPAASMRVTEARGQLERGEEWVAFTGGKVHVRSIHNFIIFDAKIKGTLGWRLI